MNDNEYYFQSKHYKMSKIIQFDLNIEQVSKLNGVLPKGYKVISVEENIKRLALIKDKPQVAQVPIS